MPHLYDGDLRTSVIVIPNPFQLHPHKSRAVTSFTAGAVFSVGWWVFIDAYCLSNSMTWSTWIPGVLSTVGFMSLKKSFGFVLLLCGLISSFTLSIIKYIMYNTWYEGIACVIQNGLICTSMVLLWWMIQNTH
ncbi:uncharacterized protein B0P05DRAFT_551351 [Gilbertella persicaria]|uniref:uncharacterized protein n=1 Tax=Gilbertella persicaria TaxID=101096 RepID=UPI00221F07E7|nr:uncharacterized protein B0P05DRAFT_551351 [Gilbertella persicaria]KAI8069052.1 hypothetical protein B0P05DRAFT_551351 [Gilbertella persicaria]